MLFSAYAHFTILVFKQICLVTLVKQLLIKFKTIIKIIF